MGLLRSGQGFWEGFSITGPLSELKSRSDWYTDWAGINFGDILMSVPPHVEAPERDADAARALQGITPAAQLQTLLMFDCWSSRNGEWKQSRSSIWTSKRAQKTSDIKPRGDSIFVSASNEFTGPWLSCLSGSCCALIPPGISPHRARRPYWRSRVLLNPLCLRLP